MVSFWFSDSRQQGLGSPQLEEILRDGSSLLSIPLILSIDCRGRTVIWFIISVLQVPEVKPWIPCCVNICGGKWGEGNTPPQLSTLPLFSPPVSSPTEEPTLGSSKKHTEAVLCCSLSAVTPVRIKQAQDALTISLWYLEILFLVMEMNQMREAHVLHLLFWVPSNPFQGSLVATLRISRETQEHHLLLEVTLAAELELRTIIKVFHSVFSNNWAGKGHENLGFT